MAKRLTVRSRTGPDGSLDIHVPTEVRGAEVEVELVVRPVRPGEGRESNGWPPGFFESTYGAPASMGLARHSQGEYEARDVPLDQSTGEPR